MPLAWTVVKKRLKKYSNILDITAKNGGRRRRGRRAGASSMGDENVEDKD